MTPESLYKEVQRICTMLDNPDEDNTAGRVEAHRYDVLPQLLVANRHIVLKALKQLCQKDTQLELDVLQLETCKHGTPFRYECEECLEEIESTAL